MDGREPGGTGRGERIRTSGLLLPKQAYYQAVLRPDYAGPIAPPATRLPGAVRLSGGQVIDLPGGTEGVVTLGIRPEHVSLMPGGIPLTVELV